MTELIATGSDETPRARPRRSRLARLHVGAAIGAMAKAVGQAYFLAYVAPSETKQGQPMRSAEVEEGRDPSW